MAEEWEAALLKLQTLAVTITGTFALPAVALRYTRIYPQLF